MSFLESFLKFAKEDKVAAYKPSSPETIAVKAKGGGKGSAKDIEFGSNGPSETQRETILSSQNDKSFGYYDMNTGKYVPAFIDMFDGGGMNTSGDTFKGAGIYSAALNAAGVAPYGYNRPRTYAQAGMENRPTGLPPTTNAPKLGAGVQPTVTSQSLDNTDANMGVGNLPKIYDLDPNAPKMMTNEELNDMIAPLLEEQEQGLLQQELRPQMVDPLQMIAMMREQERQRRNQPPTLLG